MAVDVGLAVCADNLSHVCHGDKGLLGHVQITVFASDVGAVEMCVGDMHVACDAVAAHEYAEVGIGNLLHCHVLIGEVHHHGQRTVEYHIDGVVAQQTAVADSAPLVHLGCCCTFFCSLLVQVPVGLGQVCNRNPGDCVNHLHVGVTTQILASLG